MMGLLGQVKLPGADCACVGVYEWQVEDSGIVRGGVKAWGNPESRRKVRCVQVQAWLKVCLRAHCYVLASLLHRLWHWHGGESRRREGREAVLGHGCVALFRIQIVCLPAAPCCCCSRRTCLCRRPASSPELKPRSTRCSAAAAPCCCCCKRLCSGGSARSTCCFALMGCMRLRRAQSFRTA